MKRNAIQLNGLSFSYGRHCVLKDCTAEAEAQTTTVLLGTNGQGKSTLLKCILRHLHCQGNMITIFGKKISDYSVRQYARIISYVPQSLNIKNNGIARDFIVEGRTPYLQGFSLPGKLDYLTGEKYAEEVGAQHLLGKRVSQLSGGELQLVMIARALTQETPIILMDEPMSALDMRNQYEIMRIIQALQQDGKTILFTSHNPNHAIMLNSNLWILKDGAMLCAGAAMSGLTETVLQNIYGECVSLHQYGKNGMLCAFSPL